jgi:hypothetical protein
MVKSKNNFPNLTNVLNDFGRFLVDEYKDNLILNDKNASNSLYNSINYSIKKGNKEFNVLLELNDYWKYIENGRKAGKMPPISKIEEWVKVKPVLPRPNSNGTLPTTKQLAYLIARKIGLEGIKPQPLLQQSLDDVMSVMIEFIEEAICKDLENEFELIFKEIGF